MENLKRSIRRDDYRHQGAMPNNCRSVRAVAEEILQRLYDLSGSGAHLTLSAEVGVPGGIDDTTLRIIKENAGSLGVTLRVR